jgi:uncharacterized protein (TIGR03435 family)
MRFASVALVFVLTQTPAPRFEVDSVKVNKSGLTGFHRVDVQPGDRVTITSVTARTLIQVAYKLPIVGGPKWLDEEYFDVLAKAERKASTAELLAMLQGLLADRFKLITHTDDRSTPAYVLEVARRDGKLGPSMKPSQTPCATLRANAPDDPDPCGTRTMAMWGVTGHAAVRGADLATLLAIVSRDTKRPVIDRTGLTGYFDFELKWTPRAFLERASFDRARFPNIDPDGVSIVTAVEEQLGLKLESDRSAETVLVIDAIEHPTPD